MDSQHGCPLVSTLPHPRHCLVHFHLTVQIGGGGGENVCRTDRAVHCQRNRASLPLVVGEREREHKTTVGNFLEWMEFFTIALDCKSPSWPPAASRDWQPAYSWCHTPKSKWGSPLTVLNDAMLLQCAAQLQSFMPALCLSVLKEPVNQQAARKRALICNPMLLSQLQNGVLGPCETE